MGGPLDLFSPYSPDLPFVIWPALILAGVWGPIRTLIFVYLFLRSRRPAGGSDTLAPAPDSA